MRRYIRRFFRNPPAENGSARAHTPFIAAVYAGAAAYGSVTRTICAARS
jgi:hypothetical protein